MKHMVFKNECLRGVIAKTKDTVIQEVQKGNERKKCIIIGNGHSLSVDVRNRITKHDPGMHSFSLKFSKDYTVYAFYYTFECSGLREASLDIASFINSLPLEYEEIVLIGHSKSGLCVTNASHFTNRQITLVTISTPFQGTIIADRKAVRDILGDSFAFRAYDRIFSNHQVDRDIIPGSRFIKYMHSPNCKKHINIISYLESLGDCKNPIDSAFFLANRYMRQRGDGIVSIESQRATLSDITFEIPASHATSLKAGLDIAKRYL